MRRQSRLESVVIGVCLIAILGLSFFFICICGARSAERRRRWETAPTS